MIWLASFPRSGNTFFRNVLYEVYGIASSTYHRDPNRIHDNNFNQYKVVKTHLLPENLPAEFRDCPSVYIIRDGRDSLVSIAHHRKDIVAPGSDFYNNLLEAILAQGGSFFGGWSENVRQWTAKADIVIRFEDLISNPVREVEKLRSIIELPPADLTKVPTFEKLKFGKPQYGGGKGVRFNADRVKLHFRKGKVGSWKDELPKDLEKLLWAQHGATLKEWGYETSSVASTKKKKKVMIEATKLYSNDNDGVKRYLTELVGGLSAILQHLPGWQVELYDRKSIQPLLRPPEQQDEMPDQPDSKFRSLSEKEVILKDRRTLGYEKKLLLFKTFVKRVIPTAVYNRLSVYYRQGPFRSMLKNVQLGVKQLKFKKNEAEIFEAVKKADLVHIPLPQHMTEIGQTQGQLLVTVHDLTHQLFPHYHTNLNIELAESGMQSLIKKKAHILAVSQSTLYDLQSIYSIPSQRLHLCYEAANAGIFNPSKRKENIAWLRKKYNIPESQYLLCLSTIEPRKNLKNTIRAFLQMKQEHPSLVAALVICGKKGWKTEDVFEDIDFANNSIIFTGFIDDVHLPYLYAHARALCYISHYEGFGLPILEAMICKTPVIYGNNSSMPEIAGPGGLPANSNDVFDIQKQMYRLLSNEALWQEKSEAAFQQASKFSWLKTALETLSIYEKVIDSNL